MNESPIDFLAPIEELVQRYSLEEPRFAIQYCVVNPSDEAGKYRLDEETGVWSLTSPTAVREASVVLTGSLMYDRKIESYASVGNVSQFRHIFGGIRNVLDAADLTVGSLGTTVAEMYPTVSTMKHTLSGRGHYSNAKTEYLDGIRFGGFDALALSHAYSLDAGARGALATSKNVADTDMVPFGTGTKKTVIFDVNGIKIGLYSCTLKTNLVESLTEEGREELLSEYSEGTASNELARLKKQGAQFIIAYLDTQSIDRRFKFAHRMAHAKQIAEAGADYVVCTEPRTMSRYSRFTTSDSRQVPIASSLGTLVAGIGLPFTRLSAMLRVKIWQTIDGTIEFDDSYVAVKRHPHDGRGILPVSVVHPFYGTSKKESAESEEVIARIADILGSEINIDRTRRVSNVSPISKHHTPRELAEILNVEFSADAMKFLGNALDKPIAVVATPDLLTPEVCAVSMTYKRGSSSSNFFKGITSHDLAANRPVIAIAESKVEGVPTLVVDNAWLAYMEIVASVRNKFNPFTIAITGTAGKTTTKDMMGLVFSSYKPTLYISGNGNTEIRGAATILRLRNSDKYYIQEVHGATPGSSQAHSRMVKPDLAIITSIGEGHLEQMGSIEKIVQGKMEIIEGLSEDGVLILNNDNHYLKLQQPDVNTVRYAIDDPEADYRALNIKVKGEKTEFDIVEPDGSTHFVRLSVLGHHNVSNALAVFAAARQALIPAHRIVAGLSRFRSSATRQNIVEIGGYKVFLDAFNSNVLSMTQALTTLESLSPLNSSGRRVVVMGDMGEQGDKFVENHELIGEKISQSKIDLFFGIGLGVHHTVRILEKTKFPAFHTLEHEGLIRQLSKELRPGDVILFKGAGSVDLAQTIVYPLFGKIA